MKIYIVTCFEENSNQFYFTRAYSSMEAAERAIKEDVADNSADLNKELEHIGDEKSEDQIEISYGDEDWEYEFTYRIFWCELEN